MSCLGFLVSTWHKGYDPGLRCEERKKEKEVCFDSVRCNGRKRRCFQSGGGVLSLFTLVRAFSKGGGGSVPSFAALLTAAA